VKFLRLLPLLALVSAPAFGAIKPTHLSCEYLQNPLGIDTPRPRLVWQLESKERDQRQSAFQIRVRRQRK